MAHPMALWATTNSTNPRERRNNGIKGSRSPWVVGIFPNDEAAIRLIGAVFAEQSEESTTA